MQRLNLCSVYLNFHTMTGNALAIGPASLFLLVLINDQPAGGELSDISYLSPNNSNPGDLS